MGGGSKSKSNSKSKTTYSKTTTTLNDGKLKTIIQIKTIIKM